MMAVEGICETLRMGEGGHFLSALPPLAKSFAMQRIKVEHARFTCVYIVYGYVGRNREELLAFSNATKIAARRYKTGGCQS